MFKESTYLNWDLRCDDLSLAIKAFSMECIIPFIIAGIVAFFVYQPLIFWLIQFWIGLRVVAIVLHMIVFPIAGILNTWHKIIMAFSWGGVCAVYLLNFSTTLGYAYIGLVVLLTWYEMFRQFVLTGKELKEIIKGCFESYHLYCKRDRYRPVKDPIYSCHFKDCDEIPVDLAKMGSWIFGMYYLFLLVKVLLNSHNVDLLVSEKALTDLLFKFVVLMALIWGNCILQNHVFPHFFGLLHATPISWCATFVVMAVGLHYYQITLAPTWVTVLVVMFSLIVIPVLTYVGIKARIKERNYRKQYKKDHPDDPIYKYFK